LVMRGEKERVTNLRGEPLTAEPANSDGPEVVHA